LYLNDENRTRFAKYGSGADSSPFVVVQVVNRNWNAPEPLFRAFYGMYAVIAVV